MAKIQSQSTTNPCSISQAAAVEALNGPQDFIPERAMVFKQRRDLVVEHAESGAGHPLPSARGRILRLSELRRRDRLPHAGRVELADSEGFARYLLEREGVAVVHGAAFGLDPYLRISYATATELLEEACARIIRACEALN